MLTQQSVDLHLIGELFLHNEITICKNVMIVRYDIHIAMAILLVALERITSTQTVYVSAENKRLLDCSRRSKLIPNTKVAQKSHISMALSSITCI